MQPATQIGLKIDVDTERGTVDGVLRLYQLLRRLQIPATFYFSLGPDNTGRALRRAWRPSFWRKCLKSKVVSNYGLRTILHGLFWPGPHIGGRHESLLRQVAQGGFEVGIHSYDHQAWQNNALQGWSLAEIAQEFTRATTEFTRIFDRAAVTAAAPGWQANDQTLWVYQQSGIQYASDCRGTSPFYPVIAESVGDDNGVSHDKMDKKAIRHGHKNGNNNGDDGIPRCQRCLVLQLPTTLPTLDELLVDSNGVADRTTLEQLTGAIVEHQYNLLTLHAELEGMHYLAWFEQLLLHWRSLGYQLLDLRSLAAQYQDCAPCGVMVVGGVKNRAGQMAVQQS